MRPFWIYGVGVGWGVYTFLDNDAFTGSEFTAGPELLLSVRVFIRVDLSEGSTEDTGRKQFPK